MPGAAGAQAEGTAGARRAQYDVARLLAVAVEVFIERGYDGTSMEDLARAAGISKSSIYHHVESKEQLLRLALDRALDALFAITEEEGAEAPRAIERLRYVIGRVVEVLGAELPYVTVLLRVRGNTETERWALERRREFDRFVRALVSEAAAEGEVREDLRPALVERLVLGMINSITEWYRPGRVEMSELKATVVAMTMGGLGTADGRAGVREEQ
ncbi:MAG TPA: TetR/AcrR family transcriptional regulator [Acidimicrobiales bacterium]|nr:TetR/AcrR family transcriptional regulator [Acidimicrobiales bacterium]